MRYLPVRKVLFWALFAAVATAAAAQQRGPTLQIVNPQDGGIVEGRNVAIRMRVQGVELTARRSGNGAHLLLRLDDAPPVKGYAESFTFQDVGAGNHVVRVELRRSDGTAFDPAIRAQVRFTVRAGHP